MARHAHDGEAADVAAARGGGAHAAARAVPNAAPAAYRIKRAQRPQERSCIVTREVKPPSDLIRFVLSPDQSVTPDIARVLPGRGVWVTAGRAFVEAAVRRKAFARAFRKEVAAPADLADLVGRLLRKDALQALALANKAGAVIAGFEKVKAKLAADEVLALIEASDGSPEGRRKLVAARPREAPAGEVERSVDALPVIDGFVSVDLDLALGRSHVIHAALRKAPASAFALARCLRFCRFELMEKHASGGAERRGASRESRPIRAAGQKVE
jgi:predicted RNA-binding protein YlxR (DUF448 family)